MSVSASLIFCSVTINVTALVGKYLPTMAYYINVYIYVRSKESAFHYFFDFSKAFNCVDHTIFTTKISDSEDSYKIILVI